MGNNSLTFVTMRRPIGDIRVMYLILHDAIKNKDVIVSKVEKGFDKMVKEQVAAYIEKKTVPPAGISSAIMNLADDVVCGREMILRAGDYIALQNHYRGTKAKGNAGGVK